MSFTFDLDGDAVVQAEMVVGVTVVVMCCL